MALTRKFLQAMGIEDAKVDQIIDSHIEVTDALKKDRDAYKEKAEKYDSAKAELDTAKAKIKELEENSEGDEWKEKYDKVVKAKEKAENDLKDYKAEIAGKELLAKKTNAYKSLLKEVGISDKRLDSIIKITDLSSIEIDDDGQLKDVDGLKKSAESEWSDFIVKEGVKGAGTATPPASSGNGGGTGASFASSYAKKYYGDKYGTVKED